jgi:DDE superfamily endonuclease
MERPGKNKPFSPTVDELRIGILNYIKEHKPHLLECKVEKELNSNQHEILWTPPYTPEMQPIELWWGAAKNYVRYLSTNKSTMKETVENVREGWYGNAIQWDRGTYKYKDDYRRQRKEAVDCSRLFKHVIKITNNKYIPICEGITGKLGSLIIDEEHVPNREGIPVDMLISSMSKLE